MNRNDSKFAAQRIREQYVEKENTELDELRRLDAKVRRPANAFAYVLGSIGAIVMGSGMSLVMTDVAQKIGISDGMVPGIVIGIVGMLIALVNYPLYSLILRSRKKKYADKILRISDNIINQ
ncbi:MAG: hypothetical protein ACI3XQ_05370 [Eubacteriales bacterium]